MANKPKRISLFFEAFARAVTRFAGSTPAFIAAAGIIVVWGATGPIFHYSDTWQLVINTGTTIVTFLMVFLIQRSQNNDSRAVHLKLNEIVAALEGASSRLVNVEDLNEDDLKVLHRYYERIAELAKQDSSLKESHSIEEAAARHEARVSARHARRTKKAAP
ncbi:MAG TPA: low affinity iron permease family protein [Thermoanaerobaculia bacterium]|nr:low affinity iron permease family protein [Thermoanaerobaculia bacterium]